MKKKNLQESFRLLGLKSNPYKYLKACDIYAQPSRYEGKSVAIDEAKILCKPILVTNFSTVYDQIEDKKTGVITEMKSENISECIQMIIDNKDLVAKLKIKLKSLDLGNEEEIKKLYILI